MSSESERIISEARLDAGSYLVHIGPATIGPIELPSGCAAALELLQAKRWIKASELHRYRFDRTGRSVALFVLDYKKPKRPKVLMRMLLSPIEVTDNATGD